MLWSGRGGGWEEPLRFLGYTFLLGPSAWEGREGLGGLWSGRGGGWEERPYNTPIITAPPKHALDHIL